MPAAASFPDCKKLVTPQNHSARLTFSRTFCEALGSCRKALLDSDVVEEEEEDEGHAKDSRHLETSRDIGVRAMGQALKEERVECSGKAQSSQNFW